MESTAVTHRLAPALTVQEVAERLQVSERSVRRLIAKGELPVFKVFSSIRIDPVELERWIVEQRNGEAA